MKISGIYTRVREFFRRVFGNDRQITADSIQSQIPFYLAQEAKDNLAKALSDFPRSIDYYINLFPETVLQGDGWNSFVVFDISNGNRKVIRGILLTNSCDVAPENQREFPPLFTFAPIIKLNNYAQKLLDAGISQQQIDSKIVSIKEQKITNLFYLPRGAQLQDDYIALLGDVHTVPKQIFEAREDRQKLFTLSQVGFYLFVLKLSVHFCRFHEGVARYPA
ncbi:MAG TPA: hypothetical protein VMV56_09955 [Williamwhitmania sp.]|nr:hypothetical protein [Williamwhitmania sp.]